MRKRLYDAFWGTALRTTTRLHKLLDRVSRGRMGRRFPGGQQIAWITTLGRRSGQWRRNPLLTVREDGDPDRPWLITGSNAGQAAVPAWVLNVREHELGTIEVDGTTVPARFVEVIDGDRDRLYGQLAQIWPAYRTYEANAGRPIPVFRVFPL